ncbi:hypothetical protein LXL04_008120 [Taraxacum kok-saghyz]
MTEVMTGAGMAFSGEEEGRQRCCCFMFSGQESGKIHLVLEYCKGGDLSMFIQRRQGRIPKSTSLHLMQQLAAGLKVLRDNQIIHRDLKPRNLLLSSNEDSSTLKIADFGFLRGLAETLCGSPLYMAPDIMQLHKYGAKADLWSVGTILFQLVTGRTPFTGNNKIQVYILASYVLFSRILYLFYSNSS